MIILGRLPRPVAGLSALLVACAALVLAGAGPARADAGPGSPKWAADQFKQLGLKAAPGAHGYLSSVRIRGASGHAVQVVGVLAGADTLLAKDYVLVSARLDAAGEAAVLETARAMASAAARPRRSIVFVLSGADGADRGAGIPSERIVADLSLTGATPAQAPGLSLTAAEETSLGRDAGELASTAGLAVTKATLDVGAYSDLSQGVPTLAIGVDAAAADRLGTYVGALVSLVAGRDERPAWTPGSRFAPPAPRAEEVLTNPVDMPLGRHPQRSSEARG